MIKDGNMNICKATYIYLALPLFIFLLTWLDAPIALLACLLFLLGFYRLGIPDFYNKSALMTKSIIVPAGIIAILWCFFAGVGYFYYQSFDYHFRNAVFRDLINYEWPVMYDKAHTPMVYYMGFWLLPALITKLFSFFLFSDEALFILGNILLFIYAVIGVFLIFMHLAVAFSIKNAKQILSAVFLFIFFSGLDIIGYLFFQMDVQPFAYHLDWWAAFIQYSSLTTSMFWVFNQFIPTALVVLTIYNGHSIKTFGYLFPLVLFLAPYPAIGVALLMFIYTLQQFLKAADKKEFIYAEVLSVSNIIGMFWLLPIVILYFITNTGGMNRFYFFFKFIDVWHLLLFMLLEFLLFAFILFKSFKNNILFMTAIISLFIFPLFSLDQQNNFCMRASQPALIMLCLFVIRFLFESYRENKNKLRREVLLILLLLGSATPLMEFYRGLHYTFEAHKINLVQDEIYTLNQPYIRMPVFGYGANHQFSAKNYKSDVFWQYLAKKH